MFTNDDFYKEGEEDYLINYQEHFEYSHGFNNQKKFTECLESPSDYVKIDNGTPLTTCLLFALEAYKNLKTEVEENNRQFEDFIYRTKNICNLNYVNGDVTYSPGTTGGSAMHFAIFGINPNSRIDLSAAYTNGNYSVVQFGDQTRITSSNNGAKFRCIIGYLQLYTYFIALGSVLDIFAQTIFKLYGLETDDLTWGGFVDFLGKNKDENTDITYASFYQSTKNFNEIYAKPKISFYRNRFAHDGYCQIDFCADPINYKWFLYLPRNTRSGNTLHDFDVITECDNLLIETIKYLNDSYDLFYQKVENDCQPPWQLNQKYNENILIRIMKKIFCKE